MKRKVNRVGISTLTVSLPSKWVKKYYINPGDELDLNIEGPIINIAAKGETPAKKVRVNLEKKNYATVISHPNMIRTIIGNLYKACYDEIEVYFPDKTILKDIQHRVNLMMGMEIVRSSDKFCIIKRILKEDPEEFEGVLKKCFQITLNYSKELYEELESNKDISQDSIENFRHSIERLCDFLKRLIAKNTSGSFNQLKQEHIIVRTLEKTAREYIHIANYICKNKTKLGKNTLKFFKDTNDTLDFFYHHYYTFDLNDSYKHANLKNKLIYKEGYKLLETSPKKELVVIHHLLNIIRRIWDMEGPTISLRLK